MTDRIPVSLVALREPLDEGQIEAASELQPRMPSWVAADRAFASLREQVPGFGSEASLLKASVVNQLYFTNVFAIYRMAQHIREVMLDPPGDPVALVERIAALPATEGSLSSRLHISFASKFAHFFVDPGGCPIYDSYAQASLRQHLAPKDRAVDVLRPYWAFVQDFDTVRWLAGLTCSIRELDAYLWLSGLHREWVRKGDKALINGDARMLFTDGDPVVVGLISQMVGSAVACEDRGGGRSGVSES